MQVKCSGIITPDNRDVMLRQNNKYISQTIPLSNYRRNSLKNYLTSDLQMSVSQGNILLNKKADIVKLIQGVKKTNLPHQRT